jgi:hypothetical protein
LFEITQAVTQSQRTVRTAQPAPARDSCLEHATIQSPALLLLLLQVRTKCFEIIQAAVQSQRSTPPGQQLLQTLAGRMLGGFLISTCLSAAEAEVAAGPTGSRTVRQASVRTLGAVVAAVGSGAQLAFALPGLASGLAKQLMESGGLGVRAGGMRV